MVEIVSAVDDLRVDKRRHTLTLRIAVACHLPERRNCNRNGASCKVDRSYLRKEDEQVRQRGESLANHLYDASGSMSSSFVRTQIN